MYCIVQIVLYRQQERQMTLPTTILPRENQESLAHHEAGHAVVQYAVGTTSSLTAEIEVISINCEGIASGYVASRYSKSVRLTKKHFSISTSEHEVAFVLRRVSVLVAGRCAERILAERQSHVDAVSAYGGHSDYERAAGLIRKYGGNVTAVCRVAERHARTLLRTHWDAVQGIAGELIVRGQMSGAEVHSILRAHGIFPCIRSREMQTIKTINAKIIGTEDHPAWAVSMDESDKTSPHQHGWTVRDAEPHL
jgi:hypothetical protein